MPAPHRAVRRRPPRARRAAALLATMLLATGVAACGDSSPAGSTLPPDPDVILREATAAMSEVETLSFELTRSGAPITVANLQFDAAGGQYRAPDSAQAVLKVKAGGISVEVATVAIGDRVWITNPLSQQWEEFPAGTGFNPAIIFDPEVGWEPLLGADLSAIELAGGRGDGDPYVITGTVAPRRVEVLTAGLVAGQAVDVELTIDAATALVTMVAFTTVAEAGDSDWLLDLSDFGDPVNIEPPTE